MAPGGGCESDEGSADGVRVASDRFDGGGAGEAPGADDGEATDSADGGVGRASDGAGVPSVREVDDLVSLRMRSFIFLRTVVSELSASMLDSDFRIGGMVDEAFARRGWSEYTRVACALLRLKGWEEGWKKAGRGCGGHGEGSTGAHRVPARNKMVCTATLRGAGSTVDQTPLFDPLTGFHFGPQAISV